MPCEEADGIEFGEHLLDLRAGRIAVRQAGGADRHAEVLHQSFGAAQVATAGENVHDRLHPGLFRLRGVQIPAGVGGEGALQRTRIKIVGAAHAPRAPA